MPALRAVVGSAVLVALLTACTAPSTPPADVVPDDPVTSAPPTGSTDVEPDDPTDQPAPSVSLPQLPVGGSGDFVDDSQDLQCAEVSWIVEQDGPGALRDGIRIDLTGAHVDDRYFQLVESGCEDRGETCAGYSFTAKSKSPACVLPVRTRRPLTVRVQNTSLTLAGTIRCLDVAPAECQAFVDAARAGSGSVQLSPPAPDATNGETEASPSPSEEASEDDPSPEEEEPEESVPAPEPSEDTGG